MKEKYIELFNEYVNKFEQTSKIILKKEHTLRVADNCYDLACSLNLSDMDREIAYLIGLFHDLGRFKQIAIADSFSDNETKMDHAKLSVDILFKESFINKFMNTMDYDDIIEDAILSHNKDKIPDDYNERSKLFAAILRDADKLDILNIITFDDMNDIFWFKGFQNLEINDKVLNDHMSFKLIDYKDIDTNFDLAIAFYNYAYDLNFDWTKKKVLTDKYYDRITKRFIEYFGKEHIMESLYNKTIEFLKK